MMKSYKKKNYEQALIETILKFDELLKNEKINEYLKHYSKRRAQNANNNFNIDMMSKKNLMESTADYTVDNNNEDKNNKQNDNQGNFNMQKTENNEKEIANFDDEFHKICEKIKDENEIFPLELDDRMKMKILESDIDGLLDYFSNNEIGDEKTKRKSSEKTISKSLSFDKNYFESNFH